MFSNRIVVFAMAISIISVLTTSRAFGNQTINVKVKSLYAFSEITRYDGDSVITLEITMPTVRESFISTDPISAAQFCRSISSESLPPLKSVEFREDHSLLMGVMKYNKSNKTWINHYKSNRWIRFKHITHVTCHYAE